MLAWRRIALCAAVLGFGGCGDGTVPVELEEHEAESVGPVDYGAAPWRARRRMDIEQLDASLRRVTGGIGWERWSGNPRTLREAYFETYADSLGVPDFINSSSEDLTVSLLFVKFLDDAARSVCRRAVERETVDGGEAQDGEAVGLFAPVDVEDPEPTAADVDAALVSLLLRFHGRSLSAEDRQLEPWRTLYDTIAPLAPEDEPQRAWEGVCVALLTHPDFYTY